MSDDEVNKIIAEFENEDVSYFPICGHHGYFITEEGNVISTKFKRKRVLRLHKGNSGYLKVTFSTNGKSKNYMIHSLVAKYFIGERPEGYQINHIDGNKINNNWRNLEYVTQYENMKHAVEKGLHKAISGEEHYSAKLKDYEVNDIRLLYMKNKAQILAYLYGVDESHIRKILRGETRSSVNSKSDLGTNQAQ